jgi:L-ascorbate metabolism protein UlaG (beta-lactamase superfamily)
MNGEPTLYVAGDTVWCAEVEGALGTYTPDVAVLNAGSAHLSEGGPITMTADDVAAVAWAVPSMRIVAVHMDAGDLCTLSRSAMQTHLQQLGLADRVLIPNDGDRLIL